MDDDMTQRERILQYIRDHGSITRLDAANEIGCFELAARLCELKGEGYRFVTKMEKGKNRFGDPVHWVRYSLER